MDPKRTDEWIRHYDNLLWTVSSILVAANALLIDALIQTDNFQLQILISVLGLLVTTITVYFAVGFRKLRHGFVDKREKDVNSLPKTAERSEQETDLNEIDKIHKSSPKQWMAYVFLFLLLGIFWSSWPVFLYQDINYLLPCFIVSIIIIAIFLIMYDMGSHKKLEL